MALQPGAATLTVGRRLLATPEMGVGCGVWDGEGPGEVRLQVTWRPERPYPAFFSMAGWDSQQISSAWVKEQGPPVFGFAFLFP